MIYYFRIKKQLDFELKLQLKIKMEYPQEFWHDKCMQNYEAKIKLFMII